mgnify:CR=1 FL=1
MAIAVRSLAEAQEFYGGVLGLDLGEPEYVADQGVNVVVAHAGGTRIEFVEPADGESPVARFLEATSRQERRDLGFRISAQKRE